MIEQLKSEAKKSKPGMMYVWQAVNLVMALFFGLAAFANSNDGDWYIWCPIYTIPVLLSISIVIWPQLNENKIWNTVSVFHLLACSLYAVYQIFVLLSDLGGKIENPLQHETGREMGGLLIIIAWLGLSRFSSIARPGAGMSNKGLMGALLLLVLTLTVMPLFLWSICFISDWHTRLGHCNGMFKK
ncbi:transmembrane protein 220-like [Dreissena polymorpha]|uniref:Transmembrane protein 220 n=1 Tax=Dreissena polymorpha TaxID=45954 RepID=A0A9D4J8V7_DREPO|nr:transmembrane protein 220-like [Dreissena polymorpha]XP_052222766.1 transmembrane protein 220-like [Dreissena polymorpha]XP_052222767.1 transmembrane protein 220-like [Dreissena polymorpha]XP_052222768.1 transmembrane protein 220-like [Dreissena polymorpha]XP_052222769.1 transmembrane protein 220-like [Dreissena polymorpha]KAH3799773.1 hypothetical protein DPMN_153388 [Dreissena polymorpha]